MFHSLAGHIRNAMRFGRDQRGAVLIYVTLTLPVLVGLAVLAVDGARYYNLSTELQKAADALALAGAAELDRKEMVGTSPDSIARAISAINTMVQNEQRFTSGGARIEPAPGETGIQFLSGLPAHDEDPIVDPATGMILSAYATDDPLLARYVYVKVQRVATQGLIAIMPALFISSKSSHDASASAVAGFTSVVCKIMPMFICNPFEGTGTSIFDTAARGKQIKMQTPSGSTSQYFPGNYGWLDTPSFQDNGSGQGAVNLRHALATVRPPVCFEQNGVTVKTGNIENANDAINVRFDLWAGPFNNQKSNADYRPAQNVRKGYQPNPGANGACNPDSDPTKDETPPTNYGRLPQDSSFPNASGRLGDGVWDFDAYWTANYGTTPKPTDSAGAEWSNANLPTRYQVYRYELSTMGSGSGDLVAKVSPAPYNETGRPMCQGNTGLSDEPDRRLLYAAIINCNGVNINGNSGTPLPVLAFGKFFLTEPIPNPPATDAGTVYSEFVTTIAPGNVDKSVARDQVQLYR